MFDAIMFVIMSAKSLTSGVTIFICVARDDISDCIYFQVFINIKSLNILYKTLFLFHFIAYAVSLHDSTQRQQVSVFGSVFFSSFLWCEVYNLFDNTPFK